MGILAYVLGGARVSRLSRLPEPLGMETFRGGRLDIQSATARIARWEPWLSNNRLERFRAQTEIRVGTLERDLQNYR